MPRVKQVNRRTKTPSFKESKCISNTTVEVSKYTKQETKDALAIAVYDALIPLIRKSLDSGKRVSVCLYEEEY